jgi:spermidine synthase
MTPAKRLLIYALFLGSGATALVYQVTWTRNLSLIFGASFEAVSIVLASFMAGQALGGISFGRRARRVARPLRLYGVLEIGIALFALALPALLDATNGLYVRAALGVGTPGGLLHAVRVAMALFLLLLPTALMGGTLPVLVAFSVTRGSDLGRRLSFLYAVNTAGAVIGTLAAGFFLISWLGVWHSQLLAIAGNLLIGVIAVGMDRRLARRPSDAPAAPEARAPEAPDPAVSTASRPDALGLRLAFWGTAVCGLGSLALEVMWTRGIAIAMGSTTYSFTIMLASFLIGIALGSWLHGLLPLRRVHLAVHFGAAMLGVGLASLVVSQLIPRLPLYAIPLNHWLYGGSYGVRAGSTLLLSFFVMLVPCTFMGVAFPLAGQARDRLLGRPSQSVGDLLGFNTAGAVSGSLLAGFVLIPRLGLQTGMLLVSALYLAYGLLTLWVMADERQPRLRLATAVATLVSIVSVTVTALGWLPQPPAFLASIANNNPVVALDPEGNLDLDSLAERARVLYHREGRGSTVVVVGSEGGGRGIYINGKSVAADGPNDLYVQYMLAHVPALLHPAPRSALVVGLGSGVTLGGVTAHSEIERITQVEIEPAVVGGTAHFVHVNGDPVNDPRVKVVFQDGRNFLHTTSEKFDVITTDPIHPWAHGAGYLFTTDYYELVSRHLTERGVMCQWLPIYELAPEHVRSAAASFAAAFPHATLWQSAVDVLLVGSNSPITVDAAKLAGRIQAPRVRRQLSRIGVGDARAFLADLIMDDPAIRRFSEGAVVNTDDNLYLEFASPLTIGQDTVAANVRDIASFATSSADLRALWSPLFDSEAEADRLLPLYRRGKQQTVLATALVDQLDGRGLARMAQGLRALLDALPGYDRARIVLARLLVELGEVQFAAGRVVAATESFRRAASTNPDDAGVHNTLAWILATWPPVRDPRAAIVHAERAVELADYPDASILDTLATAYASAQRFERAVATAEQALDLATHAGSQELAREIGIRLALFTSGRPYLEVGPESPSRGVEP